MNEIELFDRPEFQKLLAGSNVFTGFNTRFDIFTPIEPGELSSIIDKAYDEAKKKAEAIGKEPEKIETFKQRRRFLSDYYAPALPPEEEFMEGEEGPPLDKGKPNGTGFLHQILKTIQYRDYGRPRAGTAYTMDRRKISKFGLSTNQGFIWINKYEKGSKEDVIDQKIHERFDFVPKSDLCLPQFVLLKIHLYGNNSPDAVAAKTLGAQPTNEEGDAQRDCLRKLAKLLVKSSIPFYATLHNMRNNHSELVYGINSLQMTAQPQLE
jgi:hypothetical protein